MEATKSVVKGKISRINYKSQETGFAVLAIGTEDFIQITACGIVPDAAEGVEITLVGEWQVHPRYGKQFKIASYEMPEPDSKEGLIAFLSTLKGLGKSKAEEIVRRFEGEVFEVFEKSPDSLLKIKGIGSRVLPGIVESFKNTRGLAKLIGFLHKLGVSSGYASKIYKHYGSDSVRQIEADPYILAEEIKGFGFNRADELALGMGIEPNSFTRIRAAIFHVMRGVAALYGHCYLPLQELESMVAERINLPSFRATQEDIFDKTIVPLKWQQRLRQEDDRIYSRDYYLAEVRLAEKIKELSGKLEAERDIERWLEEYQEREEIRLAIGQKSAVVVAITNNFAVVTGGAGVGKSTVSRAIVQYWQRENKRVVGVAPTGKAAQRLKETTGLKTSTIHRLLGWTGTSFRHDKDNPVDADAFLIDEASMVDLKLMWHLIQSIPRHANVVLVGDVNQLPSVGAGNVLRDIINSREIPVARLLEVFRQAKASRIIQAATAVNRGEMPSLEQFGRSSSSNPTSDALWVQCSQEQIVPAIQWLIAKKLPEMGWQKSDIQCLSPMHKGLCGNIALNQLIQDLWNPKIPGMPEVNKFRLNDRVIQTVNDYEKRVFNGDIGTISLIDVEDKYCMISFPDWERSDGMRLVRYSFADTTDLMLAYSISIHKAQGCEFPVVVLPVSMQHYMLLQRNLYYTGITRGKKLVVVVGEEKPLSVAIKTNKLIQRNTTLMQRLVTTAQNESLIS